MAKIIENKDYIMPYSSEVYNTINDGLELAFSKYKERDVQSIINTTIRSCFLNTANPNVQKHYCARLIHRHFDLAKDERNVETENVAKASTNIKGIHPTCWLRHEGKWYPYEFRKDPVPLPPADFLEEYGKVLDEAGICDVIGLSIYTNGLFGIESTKGRESTTVEQPEEAPVPEGMLQAAWAFS